MSAARPGSDQLLRYQPLVRRLSRAAARGRREADEVEQRTWLRILEHPPLHGRGLASWLRQVVHSVTSNLYEGERHRQARERAYGERTTHVAVPTELERFHQRECLLAALARIDREKSQVLRMRFLEGRTPSEISALLGQPVETVRTRVKRGLAQVRAHLERG
jgi:RNA polymerase sigma-70 factor (ECF subfamily)